MTRTPLDAMLDRVDWRCCACGTPRRVGCRCLLDTTCPGCSRTTQNLRLSCEPAEVEVALVWCPSCLDQQPDTAACLPAFLDARGKPVEVDLGAWMEALGDKPDKGNKA